MLCFSTIDTKGFPTAVLSNHKGNTTYVYAEKGRLSTVLERKKTGWSQTIADINICRKVQRVTQKNLRTQKKVDFIFDIQ